jgi:hypothetical protein
MKEDSDSAVIRFYEAEGKPVNTEITLFGKPFALTLSHNAIKTLEENAGELDLLEEPKDEE